MIIQRIFHVNDMECSACAMRLEGLEDILPGVKQIKASYHRQRLEIIFDDTVLSEEQFLQAVESLGYHAQAQ